MGTACCTYSCTGSQGCTWECVNHGCSNQCPPDTSTCPTAAKTFSTTCPGFGGGKRGGNIVSVDLDCQQKEIHVSLIPPWKAEVKLMGRDALVVVPCEDNPDEILAGNQVQMVEWEPENDRVVIRLGDGWHVWVEETNPAEMKKKRKSKKRR